MFDYKTFCKRMPKCEFNVRWEACIKKSMLLTLEEHRRSLGEPELTPEQRKLLWAYGEPRDMKEALRSMSLVHDMIRLQEDVFAITKDIIDRYHADNVVYLELRVKPCESNELSPETFLRKVIQAIRSAKALYSNMIVKVLVTAELQRETEKVKRIFDLVMVLGKTRKSKNLPDSEIINGIELIGNLNEVDMYQLQKMIAEVQEESELIIVFNLLQINDDVNQLYDILLFNPDRISNAEMLSDVNQNQNNEIHRHAVIDRLLSTKLPIEFSYTFNRLNCPRDKKPIWPDHFRQLFSMKYPIILSATKFNELLKNKTCISYLQVLQTGYSELLGCSLSDEYYHLAISINLKPIDIFKLSLTASFLTEKTPRNGKHEFFPFTQQYDEFANWYNLENSNEWKFQILRNYQFFLSRPLTSRRKRRRRRIIDHLCL
ncbi:hypothetical protein X798_00581 [Onchocerca flexuosa]|uniref:Adenosine deaminase domain-containing protein n=1 Tax=Onchocerca flexuosa TaxID=387005 RepID=A0A238C3M6_9BILA|nr:hypothetical protein X798_00581 [Onchocerca flexuosa]